MSRPRVRLIAALLAVLAVPDQGSRAEPINYTRDIRPILAANCFTCHGPDEQGRKAKLRLDQFEQATLDRDGIKPIYPGHPERSELVRRITTGDTDDLMPPPKTGKRLGAAEIALLQQWIKEGAVYAKHWSFTAITRPAVPRVKRGSWCRNSIDAFILARLESAGLEPEPEADRRTLIRRLSLDLTGLPPTPAQVQAFVADASPAAYEQLVDRLLASPAYGEHWARMWLDLARYADTKGYEKDQPRPMWRFRDWVIDAYNADLPYDQFTLEQIAGDLLPDCTESQILATAFHRNTMTNEEGGTDNEEFRVLGVKDRVDTTGQVWMGLTMGCAKCHSHKFDPITQTEYYRLFAVLNQTEDAGRGDEFPTQPMPTQAQQERKLALNAQLKELDARFWQNIPDLQARMAEWESTLARSPWTPLALRTGAGVGGSIITADPGHVLLVSGAYPETETNILKFAAPSGLVTALRLEVLVKAGSKGPGRNEQDHNVVISEFSLATGITNETIKLKQARADFSQNDWEAPKAIDGNDASGWAFSPQQDRPHAILFDLDHPRVFGAEELICSIVQKYPRLQLERFRISFTTNEPAGLTPELDAIGELARTPRSGRSAADQRRLEEAFRKHHEPTAGVEAEISATQKQLKALDEEIAKIPIMRELGADRRRVTHVHRRGNFLDPGDEVSPGVPEAFGNVPAGEPTNRLGLAKWLVSKENPLTARVAANRAWARIFGTGIVETEEDFGAQGSAPTHPELLDWLALEFRDTDRWSWKQLLRTIVLSSTYRQSAHQDEAKRQKDPRDLLLSRSPRFRLSGETIRDQALAVSGLLSTRTHGPSVMPPQPDGIWRAVYSGLKWQTSPGEDKYRRGLYTFWRRTSPYPAMTTFDAGSGEVCLIRRIRTDTPLQALVTLNDPAFFEAAGALGRKMSRQGAAALDEGFLRVLARPPTLPERESLTRLFNAARHDFETKPAAAKELLADAAIEAAPGDNPIELAAWTTVANVLLNLDETLSRP